MEPLLQQLAADPWGRLILQHVAAGGLTTTFSTMLVVCRLMGLIIIAPTVTSLSIPMPLRVAMIIVLSMIIAPNLNSTSQTAGEITQITHERPSALALPQTLTELIGLVFNEAAVGCLLGVGVITVFSGVKLGGEWLERYSGLNQGSVMDPSWFSGSASTTTLVELLAVTTFLTLDSIGGHWQLIQMLISSFEQLPLGANIWSSSIAEFLSGIMQQSILLGLRIAMPLLATMLLVDVTFAFAGRSTSPLSSCNLPIRLCVGLVMLALTMTSFPEIIRVTLTESVRIAFIGR